MENSGNCIDNFEIAMAYVPVQEDISTYSLEEGYTQGTIFPVLNKPFYGGDKI